MNYSLDSVTKQYVGRPQRVPALESVSLSLQKGERIAILGSSGAGKTTLFRLLNATLRPTGGSIHVDGRELGAMSSGDLRRTRRRVGTIYQQHNLVPSLTSLQNTLCFYPSAAWLLMSVTSVLAYTPAITYGAGEPLKNSLLMLTLEYGPVYLWLAYYWWAARKTKLSPASGL